MADERERLERMLRGDEPLFPLARLLGFSFVGLQDGRAELELTIDDRLRNPSGAVHGGAIFALLDTCMGFAATSLLRGREVALLVDASVRFLREAKPGPLRGVGTVVRRGRNLIHVEAEATGPDGVPVARCSGTAFVRAPSAPGRTRQAHAASAGGRGRSGPSRRTKGKASG